MLEPIKYQSMVSLPDVPIQWISKMELYYPDLPGFPIVYVHKKMGNRRLYGFPASISYNVKTKGFCDVELLFLSNVDLDKNKDYKEILINELKERFGISKKFGIEEVIVSCNKNKMYEEFFKELWNHVGKVSGDFIPYGKFFEEVYSIVRFVSAWNPKTGRQSEMRTLYNFLSIFGEKVQINGEWSFVEFYLLPTYDDLLTKKFDEFSKFAILFSAMEKIWNRYFTKTTILNGVPFRAMQKGWPKTKDSFINQVSIPLENTGFLDPDEKHKLDRLVDAFNRFPIRAAFFIWSIMSVTSKNYREWDKELFVNFYLANIPGAGISEKVVACFLQQGFGKEEAVPIDTWVKSFYKGALGIEDNRQFMNTFSKMGKLERLIWLASQGRKTNIGGFFDILWCIRFGVTGNLELRGSNPIACFECKLKSVCPGYNKILEKKVLIKESKFVNQVDMLDSNGKVKGTKVDEITSSLAHSNDCTYVCTTSAGVPQKVYERRVEKAGTIWVLIDEFSGYILQSHHKTRLTNTVVMVKDLVNSLPNFTMPASTELIDLDTD